MLARLRNAFFDGDVHGPGAFVPLVAEARHPRAGDQCGDRPGGRRDGRRPAARRGARGRGGRPAGSRAARPVRDRSGRRARARRLGDLDTARTAPTSSSAARPPSPPWPPRSRSRVCSEEGDRADSRIRTPGRAGAGRSRPPRRGDAERAARGGDRPRRARQPAHQRDHHDRSTIRRAGTPPRCRRPTRRFAACRCCSRISTPRSPACPTPRAAATWRG